MIRGREVEVRARRPAALGQGRRRIQVERRRAHGHGDDPLALRPPCAASRWITRLDVRDRTGSARGTDRSSFSPSRSRWACASTRPGTTVAPARSTTRVLGALASGGRPARPPMRDDAAAGDGEGSRGGPARIEGESAAVLENPVGDGYFIHPFSRYARSAPGWRGRPTLSGCHAVLGSNSASPAWPRTRASLFSTMVLVMV